MIKHLILLPKKPLKISPEEPRSFGWLCKVLLEKLILSDILSQPKKIVRINNIAANTGDLKVNSPEVIQSITITSQMRLNKFHHPPWISLNRSYNPTMVRINLGKGSNVISVCKLAKFLTKTSSKIHEPKTYNEIIKDLIYEHK